MTTAPEYRMVVDDRWGHHRIEPLPSAEEVDRYYAEEFYARAETQWQNDSSLENLDEEAEYHRRAYDDLLDLVRRHAGDVSGLTLADIGCGYGHWIRFAAEHGMRGWGVEPVESGVEHCRSTGVEAYLCPVEELDQPPGGPVDVVSMINVVEHLRHPDQVLDAVARNWLNDGGHVVIRVPNEFNELQVAADELHELGQWWVVPPRHLHYFSHQTLANLLDGCGFDVVESTSTFPLEMFLLMGDVYVGDPVKGKASHRRRVAFERSLEEAGRTDVRRRLYRSLAEQGLGREIVVIARRR